MILRPFEIIYQCISRLRNYFYDTDWLESVRVEAPVVSIGNLSFGGTGKTPCLVFLAECFSSSLKVVVISKSYKSKLAEAEKVDLAKVDAAAYFGDEACLLQKLLPNCAVWSGPHKYRTAQVASLQEKPELILIDDGFSHRRLQRNFDLVLIDATKGFQDYWREGLNSLQRAHAVMLTKTNLQTAQQIEHLQQKIRQSHPHLSQAIFLSETQTDLNLPEGSDLFVFCGIGHPDSFLQSLQDLGYFVRHCLKFPDHENYQADKQQIILKAFYEAQSKNQQLQLVTTEKDWIKLNDPEILSRVTVAQHHLVMDDQNKEGLLEKIRTSL